MKKTVIIPLVIALFFLFVALDASAAEKTKTDYPPKVKKWLNRELTLEFKGYRLDTCIAICKIIVGADIMFEVGADPASLPKITYVAKGYPLSRVLDDILARTEFDWKVKNNTILIVKRTY